MNIDLSVLPLLAGAYLLGSIPFGLLLAKRFASVDLRTIGSGNIGATNAKRAGGWPLGLTTLFFDIAKGAVPVWIAAITFDTGEPAGQAAAVLAAAGAFTGHLYPVYLKFKTGGKGVATAAGCFMVLTPASLAISLIVFIATIIFSRRVSAGSLAAAAALPAAVILMERSWIPAAGALAIAILIFWKHRENISRLISGTEPEL